MTKNYIKVDSNTIGLIRGHLESREIFEGKNAHFDREEEVIKYFVNNDSEENRNSRFSIHDGILVLEHFLSKTEPALIFYFSGIDIVYAGNSDQVNLSKIRETILSGLEGTLLDFSKEKRYEGGSETGGEDD